MNWFARFEKKYGKYYIPNLMKYLMIIYAIGFILTLLRPDLYHNYLALDVPKILKGQIWRIVTWLAYPIDTSRIFGILMIFLYFSLGMALEKVWGSFRFNIFMFMGMGLHIIATFVIYFIFGINMHLTPDNLNMSIFLAFAITFPDIYFLLFFVIPIKAKYLGIFYALMEVLSFMESGIAGKVTIFLCFLNVLIYFLMTRDIRKIKPAEIKRRQTYNRQVKIVAPSSTRHRCTICGKTEKDDPSLEFRICSKCSSSREYCMDHLYTHVHITDK